MSMHKVESRIIGATIGVACPLLTFVAFWWSAAAIHLYVQPLPESVIIGAAVAGLVLGCLLDFLLLPAKAADFYDISFWLLIPAYLGLSAIVVGLFMGLPVGTFLLGIGAGVYAGRRARYQEMLGAPARRFLRRASLFSAAVTSLAAFSIGLLALRERAVIAAIESAAGLAPQTLRGTVGGLFICGLCLILGLAQHGCTLMAGLLAYRGRSPDAVRK